MGAEPRRLHARSAGLRAAGLGAVVAGALALIPPGTPLDDALGGLAPAPSLPVVLVEVDGSDADAARDGARAALEAGAARVHMALPPGHPLLPADVRPDPGTLTPDLDGRVRRDGDRLLPLPEARSALVRIGAGQLGRASILDGMEAVLVFDDPAIGARALAPGASTPVDRGELLAVALGSSGLRALPLPVAALLAALVAVASAAASRWRPRRREVARDLVGLAGLVAAAAVLARAQGVVLPLWGLLAALAVPPGVRLWTWSRDASRLVSRVRALGAPAASSSTSPEGLARLVALHAPHATAWSWRVDGDAPGVTARFGDAPVPSLERLPSALVVTSRWCAVPVWSGGRRVGAVGVITDGPLPADLPALLQSVVPAAGSADAARALDPSVARAERALDALTSRVEVLDALEQGTATVFGADGRPLVGGCGADPIGHDVPIVAEIVRVTGLPAEAAEAALARCVADGFAVARGAHADAVLTLLEPEAPCGPVLLQARASAEVHGNVHVA